MKHRCLFILVFLFCSTVSYAQDSTAKAMRKLGVLPVPTFGYSPETRIYVGAVGLFTFRLNKNYARASNAKADFSYTQNKQIIAEAGWNLFLKDEKWFLTGLLGMRKFPEYFWGIGQDAQSESKELYDSKRIDLNALVLRKIGPKVFTGPTFLFQNMFGIKTKTGGIFDLEEVPGKNGGIASGLGWHIRKDSRSNLLHPQAGDRFFAGGISTFGEMTASDFTFTRFEADMRWYFPLNKKHIIALQLVEQFHTGVPPFRLHALMGGDMMMRGYYTGRFRDRQYIAAQGEARIQVFPRWGFVVFGGGGNVSHRLADFGQSGLQYSTGGGVRFLIDKKENVNMRIDYAIGKGTSGFYFSFGEAF